MKSEDIFLERMACIVFNDNRPFSYRDFLSFEYEGQPYKFKHGTIRNIFSKLQKNGDIEHEYRSGTAFYTLPGIKFGKSMTVNHTEVHLTPKQKTFLQFLQSIPMDKPAIHDIRLSFTFNRLWSILSACSSSFIRYKDLNSNKDITLQDIVRKDYSIRTSVHRTDNVSVIISCSKTPIPIDILGLAKLTSGLARVEERFQILVDDYNRLNLQNGRQSLSLAIDSKIPDNLTWMVNMWHFGHDSLTGYSGEKFEITWGDSLNLFRMYSKQHKKNKTMKIRKEIQEYPNKSLYEAFMDKVKKEEEYDDTSLF